jgi:membrane protein implicated in regulation of membrane protease activity
MVWSFNFLGTSGEIPRFLGEGLFFGDQLELLFELGEMVSMHSFHNLALLLGLGYKGCLVLFLFNQLIQQLMVERTEVNTIMELRKIRAAINRRGRFLRRLEADGGRVQISGSCSRYEEKESW